MFADEVYGPLQQRPMAAAAPSPDASPRFGLRDDPALVIVVLVALAIGLGWLSLSVEASAG